jgi:acetyl-CoA C-acetyltransferase
MSGDAAKHIGINPLARIRAVGREACHPSVMGLSVVPTVKHLMETSGLSISDFDLFEVNEAFAAQYIGCERELGLNRDITNVNGSGIGLGHPIGATGARLIVTLLHALEKRQMNLGLATLCGGGGVSMACAIEMI